jgi:hypothetical protein
MFYKYVCIYVCIYICIRICTYICMFIRINMDDIYGAAAYAANERALSNIYMDKFMSVYRHKCVYT